MQRTLKFIVNGQTIRKDSNCDFSNIIAKSTGYLKAEFIFLDNWDGINRVGLFYKLGKEYAVILIEDECLIPAEALTYDNFFVGVCGVRAGLKITTNTVEVRQVKTRIT